MHAYWFEAKPVLCPGLDTIYDGGAAGEGVAGEENVKKLDGLLSEILQEAKSVQTDDFQFKKMIEIGDNLVSLMPKPLLPCTAEGCGRKFATAELLKDHWNRRHA